MKNSKNIQLILIIFTIRLFTFNNEFNYNNISKPILYRNISLREKPESRFCKTAKHAGFLIFMAFSFLNLTYLYNHKITTTLKENLYARLSK